MKNKILYLVIFIFSASLFSSAKKVNTCDKVSPSAESIWKKCKESIKTGSIEETDTEIPTIGLFFFNI